MQVLEILKETFFEFIKILPILFAVYLLVEFMEQRLSNNLIKSIKKASALGPLIGALFGLLPQCGFSVLAAMLYCKGFASLGTLFAVFIATSDEALPIMLSNKDTIKQILPFLIIKFILAVIVGYIIDLIARLFKKHKDFDRKHDHSLAQKQHTHDEYTGSDHESEHTADEKIVATGCCHHHIEDDEKQPVSTILKHALHHSIKIFIIIFAVAFVIEVIFHFWGAEFIQSILPSGAVTQPLLLTLIGLIPTCAASVTITEFYIKGIITFGSALGALSAGAGLGVFTLFREKKNKKQPILIMALLYFIGVIAGAAINLIYNIL